MLQYLRHAIGRHAEGDEVLADILRMQIPLLQPRNKNFRPVCENARLCGGKEVDRLSGDDNDVREGFLQSSLDAAQEIGKIGVDGLFRRGQLQGQHTA